MIFKNFFKRNITISLLIILSLIIIINNFFRFFRNNSAYEFDSWLSNYQGGFVRRGMPGEFFFQIHNTFNIHPGWMVFIFVCVLYFLFYLVFFHSIKKIKIDKFFILAFFSPMAFYFPVLNSKATGHKEIIFLCFLAIFCYFLPKMRRVYANYFMILSTLFVGLSHEGLLFYLIYLIIPFFLIFNFKNLKNLSFNLMPILLITLMLFFLNYHFRGTEQHVIDICDSVKNYVNSNCINSGQISHLKVPLVEGYVGYIVFSQSDANSFYPAYLIIYGTGFILGFLPLIILYGKSKLIKSSFDLMRPHPIAILFFPLLFTFPIYYVGADWGRYLYISYMSSLIIILFCLKNNILFINQKTDITKDNVIVKILFTMLVIIYGFGWTVPICCEKNFKPGISRVFERIVYYYNRYN